MHIYEFVNNRLGTSFSSNEELPFNIEYQELTPSTIITNYGEIEKFAYFLIDGIIQTEVQMPTGESKIVDFFFQDHFFNAYTSFIRQTPSQVLIRNITPCKVEYIKYEEIKLLYTNSLLMNQLARVVTEDVFSKKTSREISLLTKTATELYQELLEDHPLLIKNISGKSIAKYLGISPETLSRIRKNIFS